VKAEDLRGTQSKSDMMQLENRAYIDRREREHQKELDRHQTELERQEREHSDLIGKIIKRGGSYFSICHPASSLMGRKEEKS
jgi:uncharacterized protein HemY